MKKIFIGQTDQRLKFLDLKFSFKIYKVDRNSKNIIQKISKGIKDDTFLVSEGLLGYYTYFAAGLMDNCKISIVINPIFFTKKGLMVTPSYDIISDNISKNLVVLHKDLPYLKETIKLLESNGNKYEIVENTSNGDISGIIEKFTNPDTKTKPSSSSGKKIWGLGIDW